jgi:hypothetical protein
VADMAAGRRPLRPLTRCRQNAGASPRLAHATRQRGDAITATATARRRWSAAALLSSVVTAAARCVRTSRGSLLPASAACQRAVVLECQRDVLRRRPAMRRARR